MTRRALAALPTLLQLLAWAGLATVILRGQNRPFRGEDWLDALIEVLGRGGYFADGLSLSRAFRLENALSASYGPIYYAYDVLRTLCFSEGLLPLHEVSFRFLTSGAAFGLVAASALLLSRRLNRQQLFVYCLLVGWSPGYVDSYRNYTVYPLFFAAQALAAVSFLELLERPRGAVLAGFCGGVLVALTTLATGVNEGIGYGVALLLPASGQSGASAPGAATGRLSAGQVFRALSRQRSCSFISLAALGTLALVVGFNFQNRRVLAGKGALYQGSFAKSFGKLSQGDVDPLLNIRLLGEEFSGTVDWVFYPLLLLAAINVLRSRRLSTLSTVFLVAFGAALLECVFLVPGSQLVFSGRSIAWTFPLLVVAAEQAGALLAARRWGWLVLSALLGVTWLEHRIQLSDLGTLFAPAPAVSQKKALGYVFRTAGLDRSTAGCLGIDVPLDGGGAFYMNRVRPVAVFDEARPAKSFCALVLAQPGSGATRRARRIVDESMLRHERKVLQFGHPPLVVHLDDAMAQLWREPVDADAAELSRRFSLELRDFDVLFEGWSRERSAAGGRR